MGFATARRLAGAFVADVSGLAADSPGAFVDAFVDAFAFVVAFVDAFAFVVAFVDTVVDAFVVAGVALEDFGDFAAFPATEGTGASTDGTVLDAGLGEATVFLVSTFDVTAALAGAVLTSGAFGNDVAISATFTAAFGATGFVEALGVGTFAGTADGVVAEGPLRVPVEEGFTFGEAGLTLALTGRALTGTLAGVAGAALAAALVEEAFMAAALRGDAGDAGVVNGARFTFVPGVIGGDASAVAPESSTASTVRAPFLLFRGVAGFDATLVVTPG